MKGIILAGGNGSRLYPLTAGISKHLLPIFDKPMIYYPLTTLILAGAKEITIVTRSRDEQAFQSLFGNGSRLGIEIRYAIQDEPKGIVDGILSVDKKFQSGPCWVILGDNMFFGTGLGTALQSVPEQSDSKAMVFLKDVDNPSQFGVAQIQAGKIVKIVEKPKNFVSSLCVTGLYFFNNHVWELAPAIRPSARGETEISSLLSAFASQDMLQFRELGRGSYWLDTGSASSLNQASNFVQSVQSNQKDLVGSPEIATVFAGNIEASLVIRNLSLGLDSQYVAAMETFFDGLRN